jgi:hypothetical protein
VNFKRSFISNHADLRGLPIRNGRGMWISLILVTGIIGGLGLLMQLP